MRLSEKRARAGSAAAGRSRMRVLPVAAAVLCALAVGVVLGVAGGRTGALTKVGARSAAGVAKRLWGDAAGNGAGGSGLGGGGSWRPARGELAGAELTEEQLREVERLMALGYVSGSVAAGVAAGVTVYDRELAFNGANLLTSGHAPEALLVDMEGRVLHTWRCEFEDAWPGRALPRGDVNSGFWRRAYLYPNGDVLAIFEGLGLIKVDRESNLIWRYDGFCHHDLFVEDDGTILVLEREPRIVPEIDPQRPILEDFVTTLSASGEFIGRVSVLRALENSDYSALMKRVTQPGDVFHTNTLELLDGTLEGRSPAFRRGRVLVSILVLDTVAVIDLDDRKVTWALTGLWCEQHQPTVLPDGHMLVFDNEAGPGTSRVLEIDPLTQEVFWRYEGAVGSPFYSSTCGSNQRLPNGNTLITESDSGRAFEVQRDGTIVWEFVNPYRAGKNGEFIATLFEVVRLDPDFPLDWTRGD